MSEPQILFLVFAATVAETAILLLLFAMFGLLREIRTLLRNLDENTARAFTQWMRRRKPR